MSIQFKLFDVYLGNIRRKEDFFTYYLASCLDYIYKTKIELFKELLEKVFKRNDADAIEVLSWEEAKQYIKPDYQVNYNENLKILREFPVPKTNGEAGNYYIDIAFFARANENASPIFIGIEGKVFDSSVKPGQLKKYHNSTQEILNDDNIDIDLYLLSTIRERKSGETCLAAEEWAAYKKIRPTQKNASLILWDEIHSVVKNKIQDDYFEYVFKDAFDQLKENTKDDFEKTYESNTETHSLFKHLKDEAFKDNFQELERRQILTKKAGETVKDTLVFDIKNASEDAQEAFISCINGLLNNRQNNIAKVDNKASFGHKDFADKLRQRHSDNERKKITNDLKLLQNVDLESHCIKNLMAEAENQAQTMEDISFEKILMIEFMKNDGCEKDFYKNKLFKAPFIQSKYCCFHTSANKEKVESLGIHIKLKDSSIENKKRDTISLMTLRKDSIEIQSQK